MKIIIYCSFVILLSSCLQQEPIETAGTVNPAPNGQQFPPNPYYPPYNPNQPPDQGDPGDGGGSSCGGTTETGLYPVRTFDIAMAGGQAWRPGIQHSDVVGDFPDLIYWINSLQKTDARYKVRFNVKPQPRPPKGDVYCAGRLTGQAGDAYVYTKLRFTYYIRNVICNRYSSEGNCIQASLGPRYGSSQVGPIDVNNCSPVQDLASKLQAGPNIKGFAIEVDYVRADSTCQSNGTNCPAEAKVRDASCWNIKMEIANDTTEDFL